MIERRLRPASSLRSLRRVAVTGLMAGTFALLLVDCDDSGSNQKPTDGGARDVAPDVTVGQISIGFGDAANTCPVVAVTAAPPENQVGQIIGIQAWAFDPDASDAGVDGGSTSTSRRLSFSWSVIGGSTLNTATTPSVQLLCTTAGTNRITIEVSDGQCTTMQTLEVRCLATDAAVDFAPGTGGSAGGGGTGAVQGSGGATTVSSGGAPGSGGATASGGIAGTGNTPGTGGTTGTGGRSTSSGGAPGSGGLSGSSGGSPGTGGHNPSVPASDDVSNECKQCTLDNCIPDTDGCQIFDDGSTDRKLCDDVYACFRDKGCINDKYDPLPCWCGTNNATCLTDDTPPT
jgi:hypothetical protein